MNEKLLDQNVEEKTTEEVVVDVSDVPAEEQKEVSSKKIKDYLSKDLFQDIKVVPHDQDIDCLLYTSDAADE